MEDEKEGEEKTDNKPNKKGQNDRKSRCNRTLWIAFFVAFCSVLLYLIDFTQVVQYYNAPSSSFYESFYGDPSVGDEIINLFMSYDEDLDGKIDPKEFVPIAQRIFGNKDNPVLGDPVVEESWDQDGEKIMLNASFQPIVLSTMTKFSKEQYLDFDKSLEMLKAWKHASKPGIHLPVSAFSAFLPPSNKKLGEPWYIIPPRTNTKYGPSLSNHRYAPPPVHGNSVLIHRLLSMFHSRPFVISRLTPQGTAACIQASSEKYFKIAFRIHAEYQINEPPLLPFWFSPSQFSGNIVMSKDGTKVVSFHLAVPNNKSLNVDMEWLTKKDENEKPVPPELGALPTGPSDEDPWPETHNLSEGSNSMEVDIGYIPQMEINMKPSCIRDDSDIECTTCNDIVLWSSELTQNEVETNLAQFFYPFKKVSYLPFKDAFKKAKELHKPVHHILLWGALDDQSC